MVDRIISKATGLALAALASACLLLMAVIPAVAAARSELLPGRRMPLGRPLLSFGTDVIIAVVGTALILGIAILFTPREPPAWQREARESLLGDPGADPDAEFDDELDEGLDEGRDQEWDDDDWRRAA
jgi:hypothetical protein